MPSRTWVSVSASPNWSETVVDQRGCRCRGRAGWNHAAVFPRVRALLRVEGVAGTVGGTVMGGGGGKLIAVWLRGRVVGGAGVVVEEGRGAMVVAADVGTVLRATGARSWALVALSELGTPAERSAPACDEQAVSTTAVSSAAPRIFALIVPAPGDISSSMMPCRRRTRRERRVPREPGRLLCVGRL